MITLIAAALLQVQDSEPIVLPPGSSHGFQSMVYAIQAAVDDEDWVEAKRLAGRLPSREVTLEWDDSGLTVNQRAFFAASRDKAIQVWKDGVKELEVKLTSRGKIKIGFVPSLPENIDTVGPAGAVYLTSPDDSDPVIEGVWALVRQDQKSPVDKHEIHNETMYAIGAYLGLARQIRVNNLMYRTEGHYPAENDFTMGDGRLALKNIEISDRIRKDVAAKKNPNIVAPQIVIDPIKFEPRPVSQAEEMFLSLQVSNQGKGTLEYRLVPDCSCFIVGPYKDKLAPGETVVIPIGINTLEYTGKLTKALFIYSNDPFFPIKRIPFEATVRPAYRFVNLMKESSFIVDKDGGVFETVLLIDESQKFKVTRVSVTGASAAVEIDEKPWEGTLDYLEMGEGPKKRKGLLIRALVVPNLPPGRLSMQIEVHTDDPKYFKSISHNVYVQRGIVSVPLSIYFGQIPQEQARSSVVLTRPGRPYKVLKVESDTEYIVASVEPYNPGTEYKIVAVFTGKAPLGRFTAKIRVYTDDPEQPVIIVPIEGTVK